MFKLKHIDKYSKARVGELHTDHGIVQTPIFMPVGTVGSVKGVLPQHLDDSVGAEIILGNAYHLFLRPGLSVIEQAGGIHKFIHYSKPMLTDSGGYQVFSLSKVRKIEADGIEFSSHIDGTKYFFTPEKVIDIQRSIGADIIMPLDICLEADADKSKTEKAMCSTLSWLQKSYDALQIQVPKYHYGQHLFPIVQGGMYEDLRKISCKKTTEFNAHGYAIGGLSVGEDTNVMYDICALCCDYLPKTKARYLMGVGKPENILNAIEMGVDMFDCVIPTRNGRNGMIFTTNGVINIKNKKWQYDYSAIDDGLHNNISQGFTKSYLRHLFVAGELLAYQIASIQNLSFYLWLIKETRQQILNNSFAVWKRNILETIEKRL